MFDIHVLLMQLLCRSKKIMGESPPKTSFVSSFLFERREMEDCIRKMQSFFLDVSIKVQMCE